MAETALNISIGIETQNREAQIAVNRVRKDIQMVLDRSMTPIEEYNGPYEVEPILFRNKKLETKGKKMLDDVTVRAIPIYDVSNPQGGRTITIGTL